MEYIHVIGKILRPKGFIFTRYPGGTTPGSLVRELAPQRLRELHSAAVQPKRCSKTKGVAFGRSIFPCCGFIRGRGKPNTQLICNQLAGGLSAADEPPLRLRFASLAAGACALRSHLF